tara:strand:+ start:65 stop:688 length:624 start_codon:yes stop_codon:yes gene_type:complete
MIKYPIIVVDDFFEDPDSILDLSTSVDYPINLSDWPGKRSPSLYDIDPKFYDYFKKKVFTAFGLEPISSSLRAGFQKIIPYSKDKWNLKNCGWVHKDEGNDILFGGIVYLSKNPEKDTGTSIYKSKKGYSYFNSEEDYMKKKLYGGEYIDDEQYNKVYNEYHDQFIETIKVENVYNRMVCFPSTTWHGVQTFGTEERLTIAFFCHNT